MARARGAPGGSTQVKVSLAFQLGASGDVVRRKKVLSFRSDDTLQRVYETISGMHGGPPLWPKDYAQRVTEGAAACLRINASTEAGTPDKWQHCLPSSRLCGFERDLGQGNTVQLLLQLTPAEEFSEEDIQYYLATKGSGPVIKMKGTFLDVEDNDEDRAALSPRALSDPGSQSSFLSEAVNAGVEEVRLRNLRHEAYIRQRLMPRISDRSLRVKPTDAAAEQAGAGGQAPQGAGPGSPSASEAPAPTPGGPAEGFVMPIPGTELTAPPPSTLGGYPGGAIAARPPAAGVDGAHHERSLPLFPLPPRDYTPCSPDLPDPFAAVPPRGGWTEPPREAGPLASSRPPGQLGLPDPHQLMAGAQRGAPWEAPCPQFAPLGGPWEAQPGSPGSRLGAARGHPPPGGPTGLLGGPRPPGDALMPAGGYHPAAGDWGDDRGDDGEGGFQDDLGGDDDLAGVVGHAVSSTNDLSPTSAPEMLFDAVTRGDVAVVQEMLESGIDVNKSTERGSHVIFRAVIKAHSPDVVVLLLNARADVRSSDVKGNSVMHFWARATVGRNTLKAIGEALVNAGAVVDAQRATDGMSPLHHVTIGHNNRRGWLDFHKALFLMRHGADGNILTQRGQAPQDLLTRDSRVSTHRLSHLLTYGIGSSWGQWPRCSHLQCPWCN